MKLKKGDKVVVIAGKDKGSKGKILVCDRKNNKVIVEGINKITKHQKPGRGTQGGIIEKEAPISASNVMYLADGKPTRIGYKVETVVENGKKKTVKTRIAKTTGEEID
ncbi:MAG: 50S ribosomal protein L24 [Clostridiales bacterium]|nr:50S ribosomal protein L24 [Clostridiales bacterium]